MNILITLVIPTHLRSNLLKRTLSSINGQKHRKFIEVIVVADVVDSATDQICCQMLNTGDIYVRRNCLPGPSASRNLALDLAHGSHVMFLDDDDAWSIDFTENLFSHPRVFDEGAVYFNCNVVKESRRTLDPKFIGISFLDLANKLTSDVFVRNQIHMSCFLFSRKILHGIKFDTSMRAYEDWDFLLYAFERTMPIHINLTCSNVYEVDDETTDRRGSSTDATDFNSAIDYLYVYRRHFSSDKDIQIKRKNLLASVGLSIPQSML